jgi:hypothetical protein
VTSERFVARGQTFSIRAISSAKIAEISPGFSGVLSGILIGGALIGFGVNIEWPVLCVLGGLVAGASLFALRRLESSFAVMLRTPRGELNAYECKDKPKVSEIVAALNEAMRQV